LRRRKGSEMICFQVSTVIRPTDAWLPEGTITLLERPMALLKIRKGEFFLACSRPLNNLILFGRHVGDLGNIRSDSKGVARVSIVDAQLTLHGPHSILG
jgi:hypothetical protein